MCSNMQAASKIIDSNDKLIIAIERVSKCIASEDDYNYINNGEHKDKEFNEISSGIIITLIFCLNIKDFLY